MGTKVVYKQGSKQTYLGLASRLSNALYFCTDTKELYKGDDLYSDGLRFVSSISTLPEFSKASDGILYYCQAEETCFVLNETRDDWLCLFPRDRFPTLTEAQAWIQKYDCAGRIITVQNGEEWTPYIVKNDKTLSPFQSAPIDIKAIDGGTAFV